MIIKNAIRCNICGDEIESKHRHDYIRRCCKKPGDFTDISIFEENEEAE